MKRRLFSMILAIAMLLTSVDVSAFAAKIGETVKTVSGSDTESTSNGKEENVGTEENSSEETLEGTRETENLIIEKTESFERVTTGECGDNATWSYDEAKATITISGTGDMWDYSEGYSDEYSSSWWSIDTPWEEYEISTVIIREGITHIGDYAFDGGLIKIDDEEWKATGAQNVRLPEGLVSIGKNAFYGCGLENIEIPDSVKSIENGCFSYCLELETIVLSENLEIIETSAFGNCTNLKGVTLPNTLKEVGASAFANCTNLETLLYDTTQNIEFGMQCFQNTGLKEMRIGKNVTWFTWNLLGCKNLQNIYVDEGHEYLYDIDGVLYQTGYEEDANKSHWLIQYPAGRTETYYKCEDMVYIDANAFAGAEYLETIELADVEEGKEGYCSIGLGAFENCKRLKNIINLEKYRITPYSGGKTFSNCSNLRQISILATNKYDNIDQDEVYINMFNNCTKLTTLKILKSGGILGVLEGCPNLRTIELPKEAWFGTDANPFVNNPDLLIVCYEGSKAEQFAQKYNYQYRYYGSNIIYNERIEPNEEKTWEIDNQHAGIMLYEKETQIPVANAEVRIDDDVYVTDTDGMIFLECSQATDKVLKISAENYESVAKKRTIEPGSITYVDLCPLSEILQIISVEGTIGDKNYDLLNEKLVLGYTNDFEGFTSDSEEELVITTKTNKDNVKVYLSCPEIGRSWVADEKGTISIPLITEGTNEKGETIWNEIPVSETIRPGMLYYIKVIDNETREETSYILNLKSTFNYLTREKKYTSGSFKLGSSWEVELANDIPIIGGIKWKFGFDEPSPVELYVDGDGTVRISYNKPVGTPIDEFEDNYNRYKKLGETAGILNAFGGTTTFGAGFINAKAKVMGYGEGNISELEEGKLKLEMGVIVEVEGKGGYKQYFITPVVPVNLFVEGNVKGKYQVKSGIEFDDWDIVDFYYKNGAINICIGLTAGGGVGIGLSVNASVNGNVNYNWEMAKKYHKAWLEASGKITGSVLVFEKTLWESKKYKYTLFETDIPDPGGAGSGSGGGGGRPWSLKDIDAFHTMGRSYLNYSKGYNQYPSVGSMSKSGTLNTQKSVVKQAVYPVANPKMIHVNNTTYLFWLEDIISRNANNRTALVYSKSIDGTRWSTPVRLLTEIDDQTLDGEYHLVQKDNKIYITWQDAEDVILDDADVVSAVENLHIRRVILDTQTDEVLQNTLLTEDAAYYMYPGTCILGENVYSVWVKNQLKENDVLGQGIHILYIKKNNESTTQIELIENSQIVNMTMGIIDNKVYAICEIDTDGNLETKEDKEIYAFDLENRENIRLTENNVSDAMPVVSENGNIFWYQEGNIMKRVGISNNASAIWEQPMLSSEVAFSIASYENGTEAILWSMNDIETEDGAVSIYISKENSNGNWGNVNKFSETDGVIASQISVTNHNQKLKVAHLEGKFLEDGSMLKDLCVIGEDEIKNMSLDYIEFEEDNVIPGEDLPFKIGVTNKGNKEVNQIEITINGVNYNVDGLNIYPSESQEIVFKNFVVPADLKQATEYTVSIAVQGEIKTSENEKKIVLGCPDFYIETKTRMEEGNTWLDYSVWNRSIFKDFGIIKIHRDSLDGEVISEKKFGALDIGKGIAWTINLDNYEQVSTRYYVEVVADSIENNVGDNEEFVYIGYGSGIEVEEGSETEEEIIALNLSADSCTLMVGEKEEIIVTDESGNIVENVKLVFNSKDRNIASVDEKGVITAHRAGFTEINVLCEELNAICEVVVTDNQSQSLVVQFDSQGGNRIESIIGITAGENIELPTNIEKTDYVFLGWYTQAEGGEKVEGKIIVNQSVTLYAHWKSVNEISMPYANVVSGSVVVKGTELTLQCEDKDAQIYYTMDGTEPTKESTLYAQPIIINENITIKAIAYKEGYQSSEVVTFSYTIAPKVMYTINFDKNSEEAMGAMPAQSEEEGSTALLNKNRFERAGYTFVGWNTKADGTGTAYGDRSGVIHIMFGGQTSITLYAQWKKNSKVSTPYANLSSESVVEEGTQLMLFCAEENAEIYYTTDGTEPTKESTLYTKPIVMNEDITIKVAAFKDGYESSETVVLSYKVVAEDVVYTFIFDKNSNEAAGKMPQQTLTRDRQIFLHENTFAWEGYLFTGWNTKADGSGTGYRDGAMIFGSDLGAETSITLYAQWRKMEKLEAPYASVASGSTVRKGTEVALEHADSGIQIFYTTDNTIPTGESQRYTEPFIITEDIDIIAIAIKEDYMTSEPVMFSYRVAETGEILPGDVPQGGIDKVPNGLWIAGIDPAGYVYTGKAIKPEVRVYDHTTLLEEKKDYTISYSRNVNANNAKDAKKAPTITVKGKGNYAGKETAVFKIISKDISIEENNISIYDISSAYNKKVQKPVPVVYDNGKKLSHKKHYTVEYVGLTANANAFKETGQYKIRIYGNGDYTGVREINFTITNNILISKASVTKISNQPYNSGEEVRPDVTVKYKGSTLVENKDYTLSYENNRAAGKATVVIQGINEYAGEKRVNFNIIAGTLKKAEIYASFYKDVAYTGKQITLQDIVVGDAQTIFYANGEYLVEGKDYTVRYEKNVNIGTASVIFTGINGYSGTMKKTFKILPYDIWSDSEMQIKVLAKPIVSYTKGGAKPEITLMFGNRVLKENVDYTLTCKNHNAVEDDDIYENKWPEVTVRGKGNFKGQFTQGYSIIRKDISTLDMTLKDVAFKDKANAYKVVPKITDTNKKALASNTDYEKAIVYSYGTDTVLEDKTVRQAGEVIGETDIVPVGTVIRVTVIGKGKYKGTLTGEYRVVSQDISKAKVVIPAQIYTGEEILLGKDKIKVTIGKETLKAADYEIVDYQDNIKKGNAKVTLKGVGNYGGTKTVSFKINSKSFLWWKK